MCVLKKFSVVSLLSEDLMDLLPTKNNGSCNICFNVKTIDKHRLNIGGSPNSFQPVADEQICRLVERSPCWVSKAMREQL